MVEALTPQELKQWLDAGKSVALVDVREPWEFELVALPGAANIPLGQFMACPPSVDPTNPTVLICHHGVRSLHAAVLLERVGVAPVYNLVGGMARWVDDIDPTLPRY